VHDERQQYMKLKREYNQVANQEREDMRRIRELTLMNEDIENNSIIGNMNYKDCRPGSDSLFTNSTIQES